jgi:DNA-binding MarR family transcriptional regulator
MLLTAPEALSFRFDEIVRLLSRRVDAALEQFGLSRAQWKLLAYVLVNEGPTQSELARLLDVERASVGQAVDILVRKGLILRQPSKKDRRVWCIWSTEEANALAPRMREAVDSALKQMFAGFDTAKFEQLRSLLDWLVGNLDEMKNTERRV